MISMNLKIIKDTEYKKLEYFLITLNVQLDKYKIIKTDNYNIKNTDIKKKIN